MPVKVDASTQKLTESKETSITQNDSKKESGPAKPTFGRQKGSFKHSLNLLEVDGSRRDPTDEEQRAKRYNERKYSEGMVLNGKLVETADEDSTGKIDSTEKTTSTEKTAAASTVSSDESPKDSSTEKIADLNFFDRRVQKLAFAAIDETQKLEVVNPDLNRALNSWSNDLVFRLHLKKPAPGRLEIFNAKTKQKLEKLALSDYEVVCNRNVVNIKILKKSVTMRFVMKDSHECIYFSDLVTRLGSGVQATFIRQNEEYKKKLEELDKAKDEIAKLHKGAWVELKMTNSLDWRLANVIKAAAILANVHDIELAAKIRIEEDCRIAKAIISEKGGGFVRKINSFNVLSENCEAMFKDDSVYSVKKMIADIDEQAEAAVKMRSQGASALMQWVKAVSNVIEARINGAAGDTEVDIIPDLEAAEHLAQAAGQSSGTDLGAATDGASSSVEIKSAELNIAAEQAAAPSSEADPLYVAALRAEMEWSAKNGGESASSGMPIPDHAGKPNPGAEYIARGKQNTNVKGAT